eukprot:TRINITY_DN341_c0_g3_i1.p1 TRINITY_DN341_c0_g3~~TRINITY_DN341_c0_g3_i1.p1  ORF type:complete len:410 (+),score=199.37 TRINITY_DN341_c0_g3_i1:163-1392(+)
MERLLNLRQGFVPEMALYTRLHILQGAVAYFNGNEHIAKQYFQQAHKELKDLEMDEEAFTQMLLMGYEDLEIRRALRATNNSIVNATQYVQMKREQAEEKRMEEFKRMKERKEQLKLGKTTNKKLVNLQFRDSLVSMGYSESLVIEALKQTDNDLNESIELLTNNPELLFPQDTSQPSSSSSTPGITEYIKNIDMTVDDESLAFVMAMGFSQEQAIRALKASAGDSQQATTILSNNPDFGSGFDRLMELGMGMGMDQPSNSENGGDGEEFSIEASEETSEDDDDDNDDDEGQGESNPFLDNPFDMSSGLFDEATAKELEELAGMTAEERAEWQKQQEIDQIINDELLPDVEEDPEAYLDLDLVDETTMLIDFMTKIGMEHQLVVPEVQEENDNDKEEEGEEEQNQSSSS